MVRRRKSEVLKQLPPKQYVDVLCPMTPKQKKQYTKFANDAEVEIDMYNLSATNVLAEYARLKMFANSYCDVELVHEGRRCPACKGAESFEPCDLCHGSGKVDALKLKATPESGKLKPLLERLAEQGITPNNSEGGSVADDPEGDSVAVVASQSKEFVDMVTTFLNSKGIRSEKISGDIRPRERTRLVKAFQNADPGSPRVICMVTASGGVAITLDRADTVHIMDETWNPDDQFQVEDRIHRASRMHQVLCFYYRSEDTLQEYIKETNDAKAFTTTKILDLRREGFRATRQKQRAKVGRR
jgi:SNF2 family DNA or RNA helicase